MLWQVERVQDMIDGLPSSESVVQCADAEWRGRTQKIFEGRIRAQAHDVVDNPSLLARILGNVRLAYVTPKTPACACGKILRGRGECTQADGCLSSVETLPADPTAEAPILEGPCEEPFFGHSELRLFGISTSNISKRLEKRLFKCSSNGGNIEPDGFDVGRHKQRRRRLVLRDIKARKSVSRCSPAQDLFAAKHPLAASSPFLALMQFSEIEKPWMSSRRC